jgi:hypothetical protein
MVARHALDLDEDAAADVMCWSTRFLIPQPSNSQPTSKCQSRVRPRIGLTTTIVDDLENMIVCSKFALCKIDRRIGIAEYENCATMRIDKPTDEIACWWEETKISTHLRLAAGICVLATGLLIGSAGGAIAAADTESTGSTTPSQGADPSSQSVSTAIAPTAIFAETSKQPTGPTLVSDVIRKLQELGKPRQRTVVITESTTDPVATDTKTDSAEPDVTPATTEPAASDSNVAASELNSTKPQTNNTDAVASDSNTPAPTLSPPPPSLSNVVIQPVTHAVGTLAGAALSVPGVIVSLPSSETPVADVITAVQNILISVNDAVVPLAQMPSDLYSLLVVAGMDAMPVGTVGTSFGAGLIIPARSATVPPLAPVPPPVPPASPVAGMPVLGDVTAPAALGATATAGLRANLSLSGTAPIAADSVVPSTALSLLEHTVKAVLAPASLSALAAFALPGVGGILIMCAAGMRFGYRQAKAALAVQTTRISRFARQGPLGVVRPGSLVAVHQRHPRTLRVVRAKASAAEQVLEQAA